MNKQATISFILWGFTFVYLGYKFGALFPLAILYGIIIHELGHAVVAAASGNFLGFYVRGMIIGSVTRHREHPKSSYMSGLMLNFLTFPILLPMISREEWVVFVVMFVVGSVADIVKLAKHVRGQINPEVKEFLLA